MQKTKIIATIGPATWDKSVLAGIIKAGVDIARINTSFADFAELKRVSEEIRGISQEVALLADTKGCKIRISDLENSIELKNGSEVVLYSKKTPNEIYLVSEARSDIASQLSPGITILIDDGLIKLKVKAIKDKVIICSVVQGGTLKRGKTVNIPGVKIDFPALSKKDKQDIESARELGFDFIAASFVRRAEDIEQFRKVLAGSKIRIIAKIENQEGVTNFKQILEASDGIMIARGDLGIEIPIEQVPALQKEFIKECNTRAKPVIVATQMLQSMVENVTPTRAEVNDIANAVYDGADAVMLSEETSNGKYPKEAVRIMAKILEETEQHITPSQISIVPTGDRTISVVARSIFESAVEDKIDKILLASCDGQIARIISSFRLKQKIFVFTKDDTAKRQLNLSKGIFPITAKNIFALKDKAVIIKTLVKVALEKGIVKQEDTVLIAGNTQDASDINIFEINSVEALTR